MTIKSQVLAISVLITVGFVAGYYYAMMHPHQSISYGLNCQFAWLPQSGSYDDVFVLVRPQQVPWVEKEGQKE